MAGGYVIQLENLEKSNTFQYLNNSVKESIPEEELDIILDPGNSTGMRLGSIFTFWHFV